MEAEICGKCIWCRQEYPFSPFECFNDQSDYFGCECEYTDSCDRWESMNDKKGKERKA